MDTLLRHLRFTRSNELWSAAIAGAFCMDDYEPEVGDITDTDPQSHCGRRQSELSPGDCNEEVLDTTRLLLMTAAEAE